VVLLRQAVRAGSVNRETGTNIRRPPSARPASPASACAPDAVTRQPGRQLNFAAARRLSCDAEACS